MLLDKNSLLKTPLGEMPIFVINLKSRGDRRSHALSQSKKYALPIRFIEAVESHSISRSELGFLTAPAVACWKSHLFAFEQIINSGNTVGFVLEDDFEFTDFKKLQKVLDKVQVEDWDIIQVGFLTHDLKDWVLIKIQNIESGLFHVVAKLSLRIWGEGRGLTKKLRVGRSVGVPLKFVPDDLRAGAHAYILSRNCAKVLLDHHHNQRVLTTDGLMIASNWTKPFKTIRLRKSLVRQISSASSIKEA